MFTDFSSLINNLLATQPKQIIPFPSPYAATDPTAYYLGAIIAELTSEQRTVQRTRMTLHYFTTTVRIHELFELLGVEQISQTTYMNLAKITTLTAKNFQQLLQVSVTAASMHSALENNFDKHNNNIETN
ncbi:4421_t:CDS:2 [Dentiscutata heterogama]|uniref:4421_t:CDS:1 n=1 Tax=Dentiscutata heterogama TaxID=1316150 RepID=A0ACA9LJV4_9GLOM|nr:4421_t:CDS:2 [Dentiscutata heterogama]